MAMFKSDAQGFLVGELIEKNRDMLKAQAQGMSIWKAIRSDVKSIASAVGMQVVTTVRTSRPGVATPARTSGSNYVATPGRNFGSSIGQRAAAVTTSRSGVRAAVVVAMPQRAVNGRFIAGQKHGGAAGGSSQASPGSVGGQSFSKLSDSIGKLSQTLQAADNIDPTLNAAKEIKDVVSPLGRGLFSLLGRTSERRQERWYQRILNALKPGGNKASAGSSGGGGGVMGGLGDIAGGMLGALRNFPALLMTVFTRILMPVAALWGSFELGQWVGKKIYEWLDSSGLLAKIFDAFDSIGESFKSVWKLATDSISGAMEAFMAFPSKLASVIGGIDGVIHKIPVIGDAYAKAADAVQSTVTQVGAGYDTSRGLETDAAAPMDFFGRAARAVGSAAGSATGWVLGQTSKTYESGKGGAGAVSSGKGDKGGVSYGTYQLSSKMGTVDKFLASSPYGDQFKGLTPGTPEFNAKWKEVAKNDPSFGDAQHAFIKRTHFAPAMTALKDAGIDLTGQGAAVQDALWSTSVQFGAGSAKKGDGAFGIFSKALAGKDISSMSQSDIVSAVQQYKAANNDALFSQSSVGVRVGTLARAVSEQTALLALASTPAYSQGAAIATPSIPALPSINVPASVPAKIPPAPETTAPAQPSNIDPGSGRGIVVNVPSQLGQNVGDRGIAYIVTGGLGGIAS